MIYGYCRISTKQQSIDRQIRNIRAVYQDAVIIAEAYTGTTQDRPEWRKLLKRIKPNDTIVFDSVSRMSRNADEGFAEYEQLYNTGVNLMYLKEPHINTSTYRNALDTGIPKTGTTVDLILDGVNRYLMALAKEQIRLAFTQSQKEVSDLRQRTKEGIETARLHGKQIGQPKGAKLTTKKSIAAKEIIREHNKSFGGSLDDRQTARLANISINSLYKYKRELRQN